MVDFDLRGSIFGLQHYSDLAGLAGAGLAAESLLFAGVEEESVDGEVSLEESLFLDDP